MRKINYKSDFDFVVKLKDCEGKEIQFPDCDWEARFWTSNKVNAYKASCKGGVYTNCRREEDGSIRFIFDNHRLGLGRLCWEPHFELPNGLYPDGVQDLYSASPLDIELVNGRGDCQGTETISVSIPVVGGGGCGEARKLCVHLSEETDLSDEEKASNAALFEEVSGALREGAVPPNVYMIEVSPDGTGGAVYSPALNYSFLNLSEKIRCVISYFIIGNSFMGCILYPDGTVELEDPNSSSTLSLRQAIQSRSKTGESMIKQE